MKPTAIALSLLALATALALPPQTTGAAGKKPAAAPGLPPPPDHIVVVIDENKTFEQIIGNPQAPYLNALAERGALLTQSYAVAHPSQPNYLALFSGSTHALADDSCPHQFSDDNLAADLTRHGLHFALYAESMPEAGYQGCQFGRYFRKHNPASNWQGANVSATEIRPFSEFPSDYSKLPEVSFVIPDIIDDMHDGAPAEAIATGDAWLRKALSGYVEWAMRHNSLLIVTWDEDDSAHGNHIATLLVGSMVRAGEYASVVNHYDVLRTLTALDGLEPLPGLDSTHPLTGLWRERAPDQ